MGSRRAGGIWAEGPRSKSPRRSRRQASSEGDKDHSWDKPTNMESESQKWEEVDTRKMYASKAKQQPSKPWYHRPTVIRFKAKNPDWVQRMLKDMEMLLLWCRKDPHPNLVQPAGGGVGGRGPQTLMVSTPKGISNSKEPALYIKCKL